jgi:hypothetical protein
MKLLGGQKAKRAPRSLKLSEKTVTQACRDWLRVERWYTIRLNSGLMATPDGRRIRVGEKGLPDWIAVRGGDYTLIEMKASGKKLSEDQEAFFRFAAANGLNAIWCDGVGSLIEQMQKKFPFEN